MRTTRVISAGLIFAFIGLIGCNFSKGEQPKDVEGQADKIISRAIESMGGDILDHARITFDFRDQSLSYYHNDGQFRYTRKFTKKSGSVISDTLTNDDFIRYQDGIKLNLSSEEKTALKGGVNSIIYFAFLPYKLNDPAVNATYIDSVMVDGKSYHKIKITFDKAGGGEDFIDVYYYYFDPEDSSLDYLAYEFHEEEGGIRFRSAYNQRTVGGLTIRDYINYMVHPDSVDYSHIEEYYDKGLLKELSRIELKNMKVHPLPEL